MNRGQTRTSGTPSGKPEGRLAIGTPRVFGHCAYPSTRADPSGDVRSALHGRNDKAPLEHDRWWITWKF